MNKIFSYLKPSNPVYIVIILLLLNSCGSDNKNTSPPINFSEYYPLTKNTSYTYAVNTADGQLQNVTQTWTNGLSYDGQPSTRSCESSLEWDDQAYVNGEVIAYAFSDEDGILGTTRIPTVIGIDNWQAGTTVTTDTMATYGGLVFPFKADVTYQGIESVSVTAGTFPDSIKVNTSINDGLIQVTSWYAKDTGMVKEVSSDGETWELISSQILNTPPPQLETISPVSGSMYGRTLLSITGTEFQNDIEVTLGQQPMAAINIKDATSIMAVTPPGTQGNADISITNANCQTAHLEKAFAYNDGSQPPPTIANWQAETVDDPIFFTNLHNQSIATDSLGYPHIAYGGDHLYYAFYDGNRWQYEIADNSSGIGQYASIVLDANNKAHISYYQEGNREIKYASNSTGIWKSEIVTGSSGSIGFSSIAIDSSSNAHISYKTNLEIKYATNSSGAWNTEIIDTGTTDLTGLSGENISMAVDNAGKAHISYFYDTDTSLRYASNTTGTWQVKTIDNDIDTWVGEYNSLSIDTTGNIHIAYLSIDNGNFTNAIKYTNNSSGTWVTETVFSAAEGGDLRRALALDTDSSGQPHLAYYDWDAGTLIHAYKTNNTWGFESVAATSSQFLSIALDTSDNSHLSYFNFANKALMYATNTSGNWQLESLDTTTDTNTFAGQYTSLDIDAENIPHISYFAEVQDPLYGSLKYTTPVSGQWLNNMIDLGGAKGNSLALDSAGNLHISYVSAGGLKYASNATGAWVVEMLNNDPEVQNTSIAIDSTGNVHISYYNDNPMLGGLRYISNISGAWQSGTVDNGWETGQFNAIAIDSEDNVHISYSMAEGIGYASLNNGTWTTETVSDDMGSYIDLVIDPGNAPHISYYVGASFGGLIYATKTAGIWQSEIVDNGADIGVYSAITLDSKNNVHISYYDQLHADLRHASNIFCAWVPETVISNGSIGTYSAIGIDSTDKIFISYFDEDNGALSMASSEAVSGFVDCPTP